MIKDRTGRLSEVCWKVVDIEKLRRNRDVEGLIEALGNSNWRVASDAAEVLGEIGDVRAVGPLIETLGNSDKDRRMAAANALGRIGEALEPLVEALRHRDRRVCVHVAWTLGEIGNVRAIGPLIETLGNNDGAVRRAAINALGRFGYDPGIVEALEEIESSDKNKDIRNAAKDVLRSLKFKTMAHVEKVTGSVKSSFEELRMKEQRGELTRKDLHRVDELYRETEGVKKTAQELRDASIISEINKLFQTVSNFRSQIVVHGDYIEGSKTEVKDSVVIRSAAGSGKGASIICPYCEKDLNLPKTPKYCPFCGKLLLL